MHKKYSDLRGCHSKFDCNSTVPRSHFPLPLSLSCSVNTARGGNLWHLYLNPTGYHETHRSERLVAIHSQSEQGDNTAVSNSTLRPYLSVTAPSREGTLAGSVPHRLAERGGFCPSGMWSWLLPQAAERWQERWPPRHWRCCCSWMTCWRLTDDQGTGRRRIEPQSFPAHCRSRPRQSAEQMSRSGWTAHSGHLEMNDDRQISEPFSHTGVSSCCCSECICFFFSNHYFKNKLTLTLIPSLTLISPVSWGGGGKGVGGGELPPVKGAGGFHLWQVIPVWGDRLSVRVSPCILVCFPIWTIHLCFPNDQP